MSGTLMEETSPDPTHPGLFCRVHGDGAPATYIGRERYGCWHCHPTREVPVPAPRPAPAAADTTTWNTDVPAWMLGE